MLSTSFLHAVYLFTAFTHGSATFCVRDADCLQWYRSRKTKCVGAGSGLSGVCLRQVATAPMWGRIQALAPAKNLTHTVSHGLTTINSGSKNHTSTVKAKGDLMKAKRDLFKAKGDLLGNVIKGVAETVGGILKGVADGVGAARNNNGGRKWPGILPRPRQNDGRPRPKKTRNWQGRVYEVDQGRVTELYPTASWR